MTTPSPSMFPHEVYVQHLPTENRGQTGGLASERAAIGGVPVRCLVSDRPGRRAQVGMQDLERKPVRVLFLEDAGLAEGDQLVMIVGPTRGRIFRVDSYRDDLNLGRLWVAECEEQVSPKGPQP